MKKIKTVRIFISMVFLIAIGLIYFSCCSEKLPYFDVNRRTITRKDSLIFHFNTKEKPALLFHETLATDSAGMKPIDSTARILEFTVALKNEKSQTIQVSVLPESTLDSIIFDAHLSENGDTVVADSIKNPKRWGDLFEIVTVLSYDSISMIVEHEGKSTTLDAIGTPSNALQGTSVAGNWRFSHLLTAKEKLNIPTRLEKLRIRTSIRYIR